jgi:RNA polymerase sigma-70 factor (ECF subfamily)
MVHHVFSYLPVGDKKTPQRKGGQMKRETIRTQGTALSAADFDVLYERYQPAIRGYLFRLLGDEMLADDVTQEVFVRAWQALVQQHASLPSQDQARRYLYRIATHAACDVFRRRRLVHWCSLDDMDEVSSGMDADPQRKYDGPAEDMSLTFQRMSAQYRGAVLLFLEGYSHQEIARTLDIAPQGVKMLLSRARRRFRQLYEAARRSACTQAHSNSTVKQHARASVN